MLEAGQYPNFDFPRGKKKSPRQWFGRLFRRVADLGGDAHKGDERMEGRDG